MKAELIPPPASTPPPEVVLTMTVEEAKALRDLTGQIAGTSQFNHVLYVTLREVVKVRDANTEPYLVEFRGDLAPFLEGI